MSNYLHNLLMRSFGVMEIAQPRVASLFEPLTPAALTPVDASAHSRPAPELARPADEAERGAPVSPTEDRPLSLPQTKHSSAPSTLPSADATPSTPETEQQVSPETHLRQPRGKLIDSTRAEDLAEPPEAPKPSQAVSGTKHQGEREHASIAQPLFQSETPQHKRPVPPPSSIMKEAARPASATPPDETIRVHERVLIKSEAASDERRPAVAQRQTQAEIDDRADASLRTHAPLEAAPPVVKNVFTERVVERELLIERPSSLSQDERSTIRDVTGVKPETLIVRPRLSRSAEGNGLPDAHQSARAAEPEQVVQVTIGRIEVRAVSPPAQAKAGQRSAPRPTQSLEEYLRQRAKGGGNR
jgi:hypothetical protein